MLRQIRQNNRINENGGDSSLCKMYFYHFILGSNALRRQYNNQPNYNYNFPPDLKKTNFVVIIMEDLIQAGLMASFCLMLFQPLNNEHGWKMLIYMNAFNSLFMIYYVTTTIFQLALALYFFNNIRNQTYDTCSKFKWSERFKTLLWLCSILG